jgi:signal transduction histidine kinase
MYRVVCVAPVAGHGAPIRATVRRHRPTRSGTVGAVGGTHPHQGGTQRLAAVSSRRWLVLFSVATVTASWLMAWDIAPLPGAVFLGLAMYLVASRIPRRLSIPAGGVAAAALGAALVHAALAPPDTPLATEAIEGFVPLAAAWFIGDAVAARNRYLAGLAEQAERERAAEAERARQQVREERVRIARELHDVVAHTLAVMTVQAGVGRRLMARQPAEGGTALESIEKIGRSAQQELGVVLGLLRDEGPASAELSPLPRLVDVKELAETVRASGTPVDLRILGTDHQLSQALELSIYRVVQEALTNVVKHAPGARATVEVAVSADGVHVEIVDDGGPAARSPDGRPVVPGHGLVGMRERVGAFGGRLTVGPRPGGGFSVLAAIPAEGSP